MLAASLCGDSLLGEQVGGLPALEGQGHVMVEGLSSPPRWLSSSGGPLTMYHVPQAGPGLGHPGKQDQDLPPALLVLPLEVGDR